MTAFCPWNVETLLPNLDPTGMGLGEFMRQLNVSSETQEKEGQKAFNIRDPVTKKSPYNYQQQRLLDQMATYLQELESDLKPQSKLLLLYSGPGVGKTHTIIALQQL
ncbi:hypothetical protein DAPPUDRAFT_326585 [Daphnia pulex]|uniref:Uncharacterized protein n=1 Tax=Daphnia pulex TaxID=6669 RepID=E9H869_DAPPU|nr:hypothetical protein DAPPUDRAFT_326585 [Daphnia pulex]|eukprot:EFX72082.1 hypothetical protein DAPPUDRAFT_326585 [Daphnia pulex]